jgi:predicted NAD/FAD-binding protein
MRKRIAVIGGGVAGLSAAWLLNREHDVTLFEKNSYIGGHTNTIEVDSPQGPLSIDTGFVVYNRRNYPHLTRLFAHLGIAGQDAEMSFSASIDGGRLEYAGSNLNTLFAQRGNLVNPPFLGMLRDILRFNRDAKVSLMTGNADQLSLGEYLERGGYGWRLCDHYLLPMAAAIWSCPTATMRQFPARSFLKFFENHGLLDLTNRPQWQTVKGGSHQYVKRMLQDLGESALSSTPAVAVRRSENGIEVYNGNDNRTHFDEVVFGCHADDALGMIHQPSSEEKRILGSFGYQENRAYLHTDTALMPRSRRVWSAWNYLTRSENRRTHNVSVSYWMNRLQRLNAERDYIVSLNPLHDPDSSKVIAEMVYHHPVFDEQAVLAQKLLPTIQGRDRLWFCGSYAGYGFHEDALRSTVTMLERMGEQVPWQQRQPRHNISSPSGLQPTTVTA